MTSLATSCRQVRVDIILSLFTLFRLVAFDTLYSGVFCIAFSCSLEPLMALDCVAAASASTVGQERVVSCSTSERMMVHAFLQSNFPRDVECERVVLTVARVSDHVLESGQLRSVPLDESPVVQVCA